MDVSDIKTVKDAIEYIEWIRRQNSIFREMIVNGQSDKRVDDMLAYNLEELKYVLGLEVKL